MPFGCPLQLLDYFDDYRKACYGELALRIGMHHGVAMSIGDSTLRVGYSRTPSGRTYMPSALVDGEFGATPLQASHPEPAGAAAAVAAQSKARATPARALARATPAGSAQAGKQVAACVTVTVTAAAAAAETTRSPLSPLTKRGEQEELQTTSIEQLSSSEEYIPFEQLVMRDVLGSGAFGTVFRCEQRAPRPSHSSFASAPVPTQLSCAGSQRAHLEG